MSTVQRPSAAIRVAGLSFMLDAGFGVAIPVVLSHLARYGELPMTPWGFRALAGPFEQLGPSALPLSAGPWPVCVHSTWWLVCGSGKAGDGEPPWGLR
jgi:hypothetical protein